MSSEIERAWEKGGRAGRERLNEKFFGQPGKIGAEAEGCQPLLSLVLLSLLLVTLLCLATPPSLPRDL